MLIKDFQLGQLETNCYVVTDEDTMECAVIDPGDEAGTVLDYLEEHKLKCRFIFLTHGHVFNPDNMPAAPAIDLFLYGHTHLPHITAAADNRPAVCNCGSPTFPKGGNPPTFATLDDGILRLRHLDGNIIEEKALW